VASVIVDSLPLHPKKRTECFLCSISSVGVRLESPFCQLQAIFH
jgi:hypothetical protein